MSNLIRYAVYAQRFIGPDQPSAFVAAVAAYLKTRPGALTMSPAKFEQFERQLPPLWRFVKPERNDRHLCFCECIVRPL